MSAALIAALSAALPCPNNSGPETVSFTGLKLCDRSPCFSLFDG